MWVIPGNVDISVEILNIGGIQPTNQTRWINVALDIVPGTVRFMIMIDIGIPRCQWGYACAL